MAGDGGNTAAVTKAPLAPIVDAVLARRAQEPEDERWTKGTYAMRKHGEGSNVSHLAVAVGFEPTEEFPPHTLSRRAPYGRSDTPP